MFLHQKKKVKIPASVDVLTKLVICNELHDKSVGEKHCCLLLAQQMSNSLLLLNMEFIIHFNNFHFATQLF